MCQALAVTFSASVIDVATPPAAPCNNQVTTATLKIYSLELLLPFGVFYDASWLKAFSITRN